MSDSTASMRRKIGSADELRSVVRTMKTLAASSIGQYEKSVRALADYARTVELGLGACIRAEHPAFAAHASGAKGAARKTPCEVGAVVFGSDQGLVGAFNDRVADYALHALKGLSENPHVWAVGERVHARLTDAGLMPCALLEVPPSAAGITALVGRIQVESEAWRGADGDAAFYVFRNRPQPGAVCEPAGQRVLPLDEAWLRRLADVRWPTRIPPEILRSGTQTPRMLVREYLFVSLFRACAESLASENASRLAAMERAEKNIDELLAELQVAFNRLRQSGIDAELFDLVAGFEALAEAVPSASGSHR